MAIRAAPARQRPSEQLQQERPRVGEGGRGALGKIRKGRRRKSGRCFESDFVRASGTGDIDAAITEAEKQVAQGRVPSDPLLESISGALPLARF